MKLLTKEQIKQVDDRPLLPWPMPSWGDDAGVNLRALSSAERDKYEVWGWQETEKKGGVPKFAMLRARLCALCVVDDLGVRMFDDASIGDLADKNANDINDLFEECQRINGMSKKDIEALEEN